MRRRPLPRKVPEGDRYFSVKLERGDHWFRLPRPSVLARLAAPIFQSAAVQFHQNAADGAVTVNAATQATLEVAEDIGGAAVGLLWYGTSDVLDTQRTAYPAGTDGLRAYGDAVLEELDEHEYSEADVAELIAHCTSFVIDKRLPSSLEVAAELERFHNP